MSNSAHQVLVRHVNQLLSDPKWITILADVLGKLQSGHFDPEWVSCIVQKWDRYEYDLYDAYAFTTVHAFVMSGSIATLDLVIDVEPFRNDEVEAMSRILKELPEPFVAKFWGGNAESDGYIKWTRPLVFGKSSTDGTWSETELFPSVVPLEIGYTQGSTTLEHLGRSGGLARWPYKSGRIKLFKVLDRSGRPWTA